MPTPFELFDQFAKIRMAYGSNVAFTRDALAIDTFVDLVAWDTDLEDQCGIISQGPEWVVVCTDKKGHQPPCFGLETPGLE